MSVRKVFHSTAQPHETDPGYDQWSVYLQARNFANANAKGNDEALTAFYKDQQKVKDLFVGATKGTPWTASTFETISATIRKYGYRG